jgi:hypothetical protein
LSPTIRIDDEVFEALKTRAEPLVDTPNSVLRRILDLPGTSNDVPIDEGRDAQRPSGAANKAAPKMQRRRPSKARAPRAKPGTILHEDEYEAPLLAILDENGGRAPSREVIDELGERLNGRLTPTDRDRLASGEIRWRNRAQFVRLKLIERGEMTKDSPRGVWEISDKGRLRIKQER